MNECILCGGVNYHRADCANNPVPGCGWLDIEYQEDSILSDSAVWERLCNDFGVPADRCGVCQEQIIHGECDCTHQGGSVPCNVCCQYIVNGECDCTYGLRWELGPAIIAGLEEALRYERGEVPATVVRYDGADRIVSLDAYRR